MPLLLLSNQAGACSALVKPIICRLTVAVSRNNPGTCAPEKQEGKLEAFWLAEHADRQTSWLSADMPDKSSLDVLDEANQAAKFVGILTVFAVVIAATYNLYSRLPVLEESQVTFSTKQAVCLRTHAAVSTKVSCLFSRGEKLRILGVSMQALPKLIPDGLTVARPLAVANLSMMPNFCLYCTLPRAGYDSCDSLL